MKSTLDNTVPQTPLSLKPLRDFTLDTYSQELLITQRAFRAVLDALSRPGLVCAVQPMSQPTLANPWLETLTHMLIDNTCGFCVETEDKTTLASAIQTRNYAHEVPDQQALFAIITADADVAKSSRLLSNLSGGTESTPELGATALIECECLGASGMPAAPSAQWISVTGPGVCNEHLFCVTDPWWYEIRRERNDEFPCGIDVVLIDKVGRVVALPRTAKIHLIKQDEVQN